MTLNDKRYSAKVSVFLGVLLATCLFAAAAHADSLFKGKFKLTNEVHWGQAVLPPGEYTLTLDGPTHTIVVNDAESGVAVARLNARFAYPTSPDDNSDLLVNIQGRQRVVYSLRLAGFGEVFQRARISPLRGRAAEEARHTEATPVQVAQK
jgi:hypothetical protein